MEKLTSQSWKEILAAAAAVFEENCEFLCGLDAQTVSYTHLTLPTT